MKYSISLIFSLLFCLTAFHPVEALADVLPEITATEEQQFSVAFFPQSIPIYLYKDVAPEANIDVSALRNALLNHASANPYIKVISSSEIENIFKSSDLAQTDTFMQAEIDLGYARNFYDNQNYTSAAELTQRVIDNYKKTLIQFYRPQSVIQAYQLLAYTLIAQYQDDPENEYQNLHPARLAFMELVRLAPYLMMLEGRQSEERVRVYDEALELFLENSTYRQTPTSEASALAHKLQTDILILTRIVEDKTGALFLEIDEYHSKSHEMKTHRQQLVFSPSEDRTRTTAQTATWLLGSAYACENVSKAPQSDTSDDKSGRFYMEIGPAYSVYLSHPTSSILHDIGGYAIVGYMFDSHFFLRAGIVIQEVLQDTAHELYSSFEVYQFPIQFGISKDWRWVRLYFSLGVDFGFSTSYNISRSTTCKTFGSNDIECNASDVSLNRDPFSFLIGASGGVSFGRDPFYVNMDLNASVTAYSTNDHLFKHPIGLRLGLQYWF